MDIETGWSRPPAEPTPRWRSMLGRARPRSGPDDVPAAGDTSDATNWRPAASPVDEMVEYLRADLGGSKVLAFANPKGGVHKTTASVLAAATIGSARGQGVLAWDDLLAQTAWARAQGAATHLDGARLWESAAGYAKPPPEIAALFDTVYVSFYKGIGALPGCCVAGPADILAEVREWRQRMGGALFGLWPNAASALTCLRRRLPLMPAYLRHSVHQRRLWSRIALPQHRPGRRRRSRELRRERHGECHRTDGRGRRGRDVDRS